MVVQWLRLYATVYRVAKSWARLRTERLMLSFLPLVCPSKYIIFSIHTFTFFFSDQSNDNIVIKQSLPSFTN